MSEQALDTKQMGGGISPVYRPIDPVKCVSFADTKERLRNMRNAFSMNIPRMEVLPIIKNQALAIVAGGPSLNETYKQIPQGMAIMTCGSAHDHAISLGIQATYHIECDPMPTQKFNYKRKGECIYLVASRCHKSMFRHLRNNQVRLWHMWESDLGKEPYHGEPAYICGATVVLAAIPVAMAMGYSDMHFFGFDSSFEDVNNHHAYPQHEYAQIMKVKVGDPDTGKEFTSTATWIGQAQQFEEMCNSWGHMFTPTIYGNGMIAEMERNRSMQIKMQKGASR